MYVYDKHLKILKNSVEDNTLEATMLDYELSDKSIEHIQHDIIEKNKDRFVFLTQARVEKIIANSIETRNPIIDNYEFQTKYEFMNEQLTLEQFNFGIDLIKEEVGELLDAIKAKDSEEIVDALGDIVFVAIGDMLKVGVDPDMVLTEIFRANMSKIRGIKPGREHSGGFDVIKPEGWQPPNHNDNHGHLDDILSA